MKPSVREAGIRTITLDTPAYRKACEWLVDEIHRFSKTDVATWIDFCTQKYGDAAGRRACQLAEPSGRTYKVHPGQEPDRLILRAFTQFLSPAQLDRIIQFLHSRNDSSAAFRVF